MAFLESLLIVAPLIIFTVLLALIFDIFDYFSYIFAVICVVIGIAFLWIQQYFIAIVLFSSGAIGYLATEAFKKLKDH